jgi:steroid 5-alpha reductase family enzyme
VNEAAPNIEGAIWILNHIIQEKYKEGEARDWKEYAEEMRDTYVNVRKLIQSLIVTYIYIYILGLLIIIIFRP